MLNKWKVVFGLFLLIVALTACQTPPVATPVATVPSSVDIASPGYVPVSDAACEALRAETSAALKTAATAAETAFVDYVDNVSGNGCTVTVTGTGADFGALPDVAQATQAILTAQGFAADMQYAADGPTQTQIAMRKDKQLALVSVGWQPADGVTCPQDQPIAACDLQPEQQQYLIEIKLAERTR